MSRALFHRQIGVPSYPRTVPVTWKKFLWFILVDSSEFQRHEFSNSRIVYICKCDQNFFYATQRAVRLIHLRLFKMSRALFHRQIGVLHIPQSWCRETEKFLWFILVDSQKFKNARSRFFKFSNGFMLVNVIGSFLCNA